MLSLFIALNFLSFQVLAADKLDPACSSFQSGKLFNSVLKPTRIKNDGYSAEYDVIIGGKPLTLRRDPSDGTARGQNLCVKTGQDCNFLEAKTNVPNGGFCFGCNLEIIKVNSKLYEVEFDGSDFKQANYLWRIEADGLTPLCKLEKRITKYTAPVAAKEHEKVCRAFAEGKFEKVEKEGRFNEKSEILAGYERRSSYPTDKILNADLDHDGQIDSIVSIQVASSAGKGCDFEFLVQTTADGKDLAALLPKVEKKNIGAVQGDRVSTQLKPKTLAYALAVLTEDGYGPRCNTRYAWWPAKIENRWYVLGSPSEKLSSESNSPAGLFNRVLYEYRTDSEKGGHFEAVCTQKPVVSVQAVPVEM